MPKKIMIIDDDPTVVKYLQAVFSDNGYATCTAGSTMEGLEERFINSGINKSNVLPNSVQ